MKKVLKTRIAGDLFYSISAVLIMNGVLQLFVYPQLNKKLGADGLGDVLYLLGIIAIVSSSIGAASNNTRLVIRNKHSVTNGDFLLVMVILSLLGVLIGFLSVRAFVGSAFELVGFLVLLVFTAFRYYCDVEFRLLLNYKRYFIYYLFLTIGYCLGVLGYYFGLERWFFVFLLGESAAIFFVITRGTILTKQLNLSQFKNVAVKNTAILAVSYLLFNSIQNIDRIILQNIVGSQAVSEYYVASLLGKTLAMLTVPLNSVIISYITNAKTKITKTQFAKMSGVVVLISAVFFVACCIFAPVFIKIFYPNLVEATKGLTVIANLAQIFCFASTIFLTVVLTIASEKMQFFIQLLFALLFVAVSIPMTLSNGVYGFAVAAVFANAFRFVLVIVIGLIKAPKSSAIVKI